MTEGPALVLQDTEWYWHYHRGRWWLLGNQHSLSLESWSVASGSFFWTKEWLDRWPLQNGQLSWRVRLGNQWSPCPKPWPVLGEQTGHGTLGMLPFPWAPASFSVLGQRKIHHNRGYSVANITQTDFSKEAGQQQCPLQGQPSRRRELICSEPIYQVF